MKKLYMIMIALFFGAVSYAQCIVPVLSDAADPDAICSGTSAELSATTSAGTIHWYQSATSPNSIGTGSSFTTTPLNGTTSFWVEGQNTFVGAAQSGGGKLAPTSTGGASVNTATPPWGLVFNATQDFLLNSVDVFLTSQNPGTIVLQLKDISFNILETISVAAPAGGTGSNPVQFTVPLNLTIPQGTGYRLVVVSNPPMIRDLGANAFPFPIGTVGTITQGTINNSNTSNPGVYYFLYNWNFSPISVCSSDREEVIVTVNPTPDAPSGDTEQEFTEGETLADLDVMGTGLVWYSDAGGMNQIPDTTVLTDDTTYYVSQTDGDCTSELLAITVNNPLAVGQHQFNGFAFYPNPASSIIKLENAIQIDSVEIYTMQGRKVFDISVKQLATSIDIQNLSAGTYFLKVASDGAVKTTKLIIQ